jgi:hypothetical protein
MDGQNQASSLFRHLPPVPGPSWGPRAHSESSGEAFPDNPLGSTAAWPVVARAQSGQAMNIRRVVDKGAAGRKCPQ